MAAQKQQISTNLQKKAFYTRGWDVPVPGQRRLYFARLDVIKSNVASLIIPIPSSQHVSIRGKGHTVDFFVAPQGRLALEVARRPFRPDLEGLVTTATDEHIAIWAEAERKDPVFGISQRVQHEGMNSSNTEVINSPARVPGQGRANGLPCCRVPQPYAVTPSRSIWIHEMTA